MYLFFLAVSLLSFTTAIEDVFNEELLIRQLPSGHVYSFFHFVTKWNVNVFEQELPTHFNLFPKSFAEIVSTFGIAELHLSLTQGRWRYNKWGYPILAAPPGIELWVWFHPDLNVSSVDRKWKGLVHALSGQFCSSLNFINTAVTARPELSMKPLGVWQENVDSRVHLRYATLSRETVCTENLTPWKKLLPCSGQAGLGSLLNALHLYDSSYHSLAIHLRTIQDGDEMSEVKLELKQTVSSVFDPVHSNVKNEWSLGKLFGTKLASVCPLASHSFLMIDMNQDNVENLSLNPQPDEMRKDSLNQSMVLATYDLKKIDFTSAFDVKAKVSFKSSDIHPPYLLVRKYTRGYGEEMGGIVCSITNSHATDNILISYLDVVPYFVRTYFHTLRVSINGVQIQPDRLKFTPAYHRERPATIEFMLTLPPLSTTTVSIDFEKVFLDWMQHPPDSHHGLYIGSSVVSVSFPDGINSSGINERCSSLKICSVTNPKNTIFRRIYTDPVLIRVPLPDFSMPYNVICLTCTVLAIAFGSMYNLTTRTFQVEVESEKKTLKEKLKTIIARLFGGKKEKES